MRCVDEQNNHLKAECQEAWDQLNAHGSVSRNSRPSSYVAAVSADSDNTCVHSVEEQLSD